MFVLVLDRDTSSADQRDWDLLSRVAGNQWRCGEEHISELPEGAIVLAHRYSDAALDEKLSGKRNLIVIVVSGWTGSEASEGEAERLTDGYGWLYRRGASVTRAGMAEFVRCLHNFIHVKELLADDHEPPFLLLEPIEAGQAWRNFVDRCADGEQARADFQRRVPLYRLAGFKIDPRIETQVAEETDNESLRTLLGKVRDNLREWANIPPPPERPDWFKIAWKIGHNDMKGGICMSSGAPDILYGFLAEPFLAEVFNNLELVRRGWQKWSEEQPIPLQNLRRFETLCTELRTAIDKFIRAEEAMPPATDEAEAVRKTAFEVSELLSMFQPPNDTSVLFRVPEAESVNRVGEHG
jgi:hypothetical protein